MDKLNTHETTTSNEPAHTVDHGLKHEAPARKKTWGERVFNWGTYGGVAMLGNEIASLFVTRSIDENGKYRKKYVGFVEKFSKLGEHTQIQNKQILPEYIVGSSDPAKFVKGEPLKPRLPFLLVATIGGMFMVPFVKYLEDHKGEIVRKLDRKHYGNASDTDPKLMEAHHEMDEAPKQTWGSLGKGRMTTVVAAAVADATFGWDYALTTKIFGKEASLNGLARWTADKSAKLFGKEGNIAFKDAVDRGTWLLTLSSTLTVLFYLSAKLFAKKQEEKKEEKQEERFMRANGTYSDVAEEIAQTSQAEAATEKTSDKPTAQVRNISREQTISSVPQLSQGA